MLNVLFIINGFMYCFIKTMHFIVIKKFISLMMTLSLVWDLIDKYFELNKPHRLWRFEIFTPECLAYKKNVYYKYNYIVVPNIN